jgi:hypothetical protein
MAEWQNRPLDAIQPVVFIDAIHVKIRNGAVAYRPEPPGLLDRPTRQVIRRYERDRPSELLHVDVKKRGRIPDPHTPRLPRGTRRRKGHHLRRLPVTGSTLLHHTVQQSP